MKPISTQDAKEQIANKYGFSTLEEACPDGSVFLKYLDELMELYKSSALASKEQEIEELRKDREWIRFEDRKPNIGQHIVIAWPSGTDKYRPEYRHWTTEFNGQDWSQMRWLPIPDADPLPR